LNNGDVTLSSTAVPRKINGDINENYQGSITGMMQSYLVDNFGITEFRNVNIYGPHDGGVDLNGKTLINVGLVGNYAGAVIDNITVKGVLDIKGSAPIEIKNSSKNGYLKFIGNVGNTNVRYYNFVIVDVTALSSNVSKIGFNNAEGIGKADVIIFGNKNQAITITDDPSYNRPTYRAFENGSGVRKYAPNSGLGDIKYQSPSSPIGNGRPKLDESDWESAGNATSYVSPTMTVDSGKVWTAADFTNGTIALSPFPSGIYLAGAMPAWARTATPAGVLMGRKKDWEPDPEPEPNAFKPRGDYKFIVHAAKGRERMG
jgi:hypothetical protein